MPGTTDPNLEQLGRVAQRLGILLNDVTLVGGTAAGLLITDLAAEPVRPTTDVDVVVEATTYVEFHAFGRKLEAVGFRQHTRADDPVCRWRAEELVLDVMPLDENILGFSNRWYASAIPTRSRLRLPSGMTIHHVDAPHFIATKFEAFRSRGGGDYPASHDLEDVVRVVDGRESAEAEIARAPAELREFVQTEVGLCLHDRYFIEALPSYFSRRTEGAARAPIIIERLRQIAAAR